MSDRAFGDNWELCRQAIDTTWYYSIHWPEENWQAKALRDCKDRLESINKKRTELLLAYDYLNNWIETSEFHD